MSNRKLTKYETEKVQLYDRYQEERGSQTTAEKIAMETRLFGYKDDFFARNLPIVRAKMSVAFILEKEAYEEKSKELRYKRLQIAYQYLLDFKDFCREYGGSDGAQWFSRMYEHLRNSKNPDFSKLEVLKEAIERTGGAK